MKIDLSLNSDFKKDFWKLIGPILLALYLFWLTSGIDIFFASKISPAALAALQAVFPLFFLLLSINEAFSIATNNLVSVALGKNDFKAQAGYVKVAIFLTLVIWGLFILLGPYLARYVLNLLHISGEVLKLGLDYINTLFILSGFYLLMGTFWSLLVIFKKQRDIILFALLTLLINALLNWFFVFVMGYKTLGIALGTSIMNIILVFLFWLKFGKKNNIIRWNIISFEEAIKKYLKEFLRYFLVAWVSVAIFVLEFIINNYFVSKFGTSALAGYGLASWAINFVNYPIFALGIVFATIFGFWLGKNDKNILIQIWKFFKRINWIYISIALTIINIFIKNLLPLFTKNQEILSYANLQLVIFSIFLPIFTFMFFYSNFFQVVGLHWQRMFLNILLVTLIGLMEYLFYEFGKGYIYVWLGWLSAYLLVLILSSIFFKKFGKNIFIKI